MKTKSKMTQITNIYFKTTNQHYLKWSNVNNIILEHVSNTTTTHKDINTYILSRVGWVPKYLEL